MPELRGIANATLEVGEMTTLAFHLNANDLAFTLDDETTCADEDWPAAQYGLL